MRLFIAELLENDVPPGVLLKAQGFDAQAPDLLKYPGQPSIPKGNGRESGQYTYGAGQCRAGGFSPPERNAREQMERSHI